MSDRAEVALAIKIEAYKETVTQEVKKCLAGCDAVYKVDDIYLFYWESTKWHPFFENVRTINSYLEECLEECLDDEEYALKVLWPQIEEDCEDDRGNPSCFDIYVKYEIELPSERIQLDSEEFFSSNAVKFISNIT